MKMSTRKIMALGFSGAYIILTIMCTYMRIDMPYEFVAIVSMVVGHYFGKSTALDVPGGKQNEHNKEIN